MDFSEFQAYYEVYKDRIYSYLYYRSGRNKATAEDLTADVFLKALEKRHTFQKEANFQPWIYTIAHHHLVDFYRKTHTTVNLADLENVLETEVDPKSSLMRRIAAEEVEELLQYVTDEEKEILLMRYHQDLPLADIAEIVDRPEPTVRVIVHRALQKLRNKYAAKYEE